MLTVFDTSAIVAANTLGHSQFAWANQRLEQVQVVALCAHSLAECFSVITSSPQIRLPPAQAIQLLESLSQTWTVIQLDAADYLRAAHRCRELGLQGGAIYDMLVAEAALKVGAKGLVTLNPKHFRRLGPDVERLVLSP